MVVDVATFDVGVIRCMTLFGGDSGGCVFLWKVMASPCGTMSLPTVLL